MILQRKQIFAFCCHKCSILSAMNILVFIAYSIFTAPAVWDMVSEKIFITGKGLKLIIFVMFYEYF